MTSDSASTPSRGDVVDARERVERGVLERVHDVVLVDELEPRVEAEHHRHQRQREHARERGVDVGPEHVGAAQHGHRDVGVALGEVGDRLLGLDDVALERRCAGRAGGASPR